MGRVVGGFYYIIYYFILIKCCDQEKVRYGVGSLMIRTQTWYVTLVQINWWIQKNCMYHQPYATTRMLMLIVHPNSW